MVQRDLDVALMIFLCVFFILELLNKWVVLRHRILSVSLLALVSLLHEVGVLERLVVLILLLLIKLVA